MIPFVLGMICGFFLAVLLICIFAIVISSGKSNRNEEKWNEI